jgi:hypothetical protein
MDTALKITIEVFCAAVLIYILFREAFEITARKLEARAAKLFHSVRRTDGPTRH